MANAAVGLFKIILGAVFIILGLLGILKWWPQLLDIIKGSVGIIVGLIGLLLVMLSFSDLRD